MRNIQETGDVRNCEVALRRKTGRRCGAGKLPRGAPTSMANHVFEGTLTDITEAHELSRQLSYEASHDALTGLINRREFELRLQRALESCQPGKLPMRSVSLDLDNFRLSTYLRGTLQGMSCCDSWRRP